jgi:hypothetical protein
MGLDITAYSRLKHIGKHAEECEEQYDPETYDRIHVHAYAYTEFPDSFRGIPIVGTKHYRSSEFIEGGCYAITDETETHRFRAGSYSGYNRWREDLARQFNPAPITFDRGPRMAKPEPEKPFYELIWFADNEGTIGPEAALDLLADFDLHVNLYEGDEYARSKYADWHKAFKLAADGGLVDFH